ncbi:MAG: ATP-binding protein [Candidatus Helarchaeota archaeon]
MPWFEFIVLISAIITLFFGIHIYYQNPTHKMNRLFLLSCIFMSIWGISEFGRLSAFDLGTAIIWIRISAISYFAIPTLFYFVLSFSPQIKFIETKRFCFLTYTPAAIFMIIDLTTHWIIGPPLLSPYGWDYGLPEVEIVYILSYLWAVILSILTLFYIVRIYLHEESPLRRKQAKFILLGIFTIIVLVAVIEEVLPAMEIYVPELTPIFFSFGCFFFGYAMKYRLFLTPEYEYLIDNLFMGFIYGEILVDQKKQPVDFICLEVNKTFIRFIGETDKENIIGQRFSKIVQFRENERQKIIEIAGRVAQTREQSKIDLYLADLQRWLSISVFSNKKGEFVALIEDITDRMLLIEEVTKQNKALLELDRLKNEFYEDVTHELQTPLVAIRGFAELLYNSPTTPKKIRKDIGIILRNEKRLEQLIREITDYSRISYLPFDLKKDKVRLSEIINECIETIEPIIRQKQLKIKRYFGKDIEINLNKDLISKLVQNLLTNAVKFSYPNTTIRIHSDVDGFWKFAVKDEGIGIHSQDLPKLFQRFKRIQRPDSLEPPPNGIGIGLALCKKVVDLYNGVIWAESPGPKKGSIFSVYIPLP